MQEVISATKSQSERIDTALGKLPSNWEVRRLSDACRVNPDSFSIESHEGETFEYITLSTVDGGVIHCSETTPIADAPSRAKRKVKKGDVLVGTVRPKQRSHGFVTPEHDGKVCSTGFGVLRPKDELNSQYLLQEILAHRFFRQMMAYVAGSGYPAVKLSDLNKHRIALPPLDEQRKIASVLATVDAAIQKTEAVIEQAKRVKRGIKQTLFAEGAVDHQGFRETKLGKHPANWDLARFEDLISDTRYGTDNKSNTEGEGYPTLRIPNVVNRRITLDDLKHTPLSSGELERLRLEEGDLLVVRTNGNPDYVGRCATFSNQNEDFVYASYLIRMRLDESRVRPAFVREFLNSYRGRTEMSGWIRSSAGNYNLSVGAIEKFQIPVPPLEEQDAILRQFRAAEKAIQNNRGLVSRLSRVKKGLMQDLLTGRVRTDDKDIAILDEVAARG